LTGEWRKLHNEELHDLYSSSSIIRTTKAKRIGWARHVARMAEERNAYRLMVWEGQREGGHYENRDVGGWIILQWIL
jgi:hypothetical protein